MQLRNSLLTVYFVTAVIRKREKGSEDEKMNRFAFLIKTVLLALVIGCFSVSAFPEEEEKPKITANIQMIDKFGNVVLDVPASEMVRKGIEIGDMAEVTIKGMGYNMPVVANFSDVDLGSYFCRLVIKPDLGEDYVVLGINMGDFAKKAGISDKDLMKADPDDKRILQGTGDPSSVVITLKEKDGYDDQLKLHQLRRSENREDYPDLNDAEYANFREITTTGMGKHALYRSSSPVNPEMNRNLEADAASADAGIKTCMNMADSEEVLYCYDGYDKSYYSRQAIICLDMVVDYQSEDFEKSLADGFTFLTEHEGPFLIHCNEGKDRAGFGAAVLEAFMGASADEIVSDYMVTYYNYYGVEPGTDLYTKIADANIRKILPSAFHMESLDEPDLSEKAEAYLKSIGLTDEKIEILREKLGKDYNLD